MIEVGVVLTALLLAYQALSQTVNDLAPCAQTCLSNSTTTETVCQLTDLKCLCTNFEYIGALSCCLATQCNTSEQAAAILFNQAECASVNETAPGFVGCSPAGLTTSVAAGETTTMEPFTVSSSSSTSSGSSAPVLASSLSGSTDVGLQTIAPGFPSSATWKSQALLTGSCTTPYFAMITVPTGMVVLYPQIGCSPDRQDCCPYPFSERAYLSECPKDYFTTRDGCCPSGYQVYSTTLGEETPCFSTPTVTYEPGTSPTATLVTLINHKVFTRMYTLDPSITHNSELSAGAIAGIAVGSVIGLILIAFAFIMLRRLRHRRIENEDKQSRVWGQEMEEPVLGSADGISPRGNPTSPVSAGSGWQMRQSNPPTYEDVNEQPNSEKGTGPQELPGSLFMHQHHPAFQREASSELESQRQVSPPISPPRTPTRPSGQRLDNTHGNDSPIISPASTSMT